MQRSCTQAAAYALIRFVQLQNSSPQLSTVLSTVCKNKLILDACSDGEPVSWSHHSKQALRASCVLAVYMMGYWCPLKTPDECVNRPQQKHSLVSCIISLHLECVEACVHQNCRHTPRLTSNCQCNARQDPTFDQLPELHQTAGSLLHPAVAA